MDSQAGAIKGRPAVGLRQGDRIVVDRAHFPDLFRVLRQRGYTLVGPTARDGAIVCEQIEGVEDLPVGWTDEQDASRYRLKRRDDAALFGYAVGPHSWKKYFHEPVLTLWKARRSGAGFEVSTDDEPRRKLALIGARSCELHAIAIQDRVLRGTGGLSASGGTGFQPVQGTGWKPVPPGTLPVTPIADAADPHYVRRRRDVFVVAVNCGEPAGTCFCASMDTGPKATQGFDLAVTELLSPETHEFLVEIGTEAGAEIARQITFKPAGPRQLRAAQALMEETAERQGRSLDTQDIKELLYRNQEHKRWDEVAQRCLACANCTMVCPTCFCTNVEDTTDLTGQEARRVRVWDSCFNLSFSYIVGGHVRRSIASRYRQWLTHKLASWQDQFGTSGCVGCGRCITWCPVGIDLTEEVRAIRAPAGRLNQSDSGAARADRSRSEQ